MLKAMQLTLMVLVAALAVFDPAAAQDRNERRRGDRDARAFEFGEGCIVNGEKVPVLPGSDTEIAVAIHDRERGPRIVYNRRAIARVSDTMREFFFWHECAHHILGHVAGRANPAMEDQADCWAVQYMMARGTLEVDDFAEMKAPMEEMLRAGITHSPGRTRARNLYKCVGGENGNRGPIGKHCNDLAYFFREAANPSRNPQWFTIHVPLRCEPYEHGFNCQSFDMPGREALEARDMVSLEMRACYVPPFLYTDEDGTITVTGPTHGSKIELSGRSRVELRLMPASLAPTD